MTMFGACWGGSIFAVAPSEQRAIQLARAWARVPITFEAYPVSRELEEWIRANPDKATSHNFELEEPRVSASQLIA